MGELIPFEKDFDELMYGQHEDEDDYWLGEKDLTEVIE
jgi:hypothetical protein